MPDNPNLAPTERAAVIHMEFGKRTSSPMDWGFTVPGKMDVINARVETIFETSMFERFINQKRCLVPAMGFYEWSGPKGNKQPWCFRAQEQRPLMLAGVWREYVGRKQFAILTTNANELLNGIHDRMPCIVPPEHEELWLTGPADQAVAQVLAPYPAQLMTSYRVTKAMGNPKYKNPEVYEPLRSLFDE